MDDWANDNETSLLEKKDFYSHLNMKDIADVDNVQAKKVFKDSKIKNYDMIYIICSKRHIIVS